MTGCKDETGRDHAHVKIHSWGTAWKAAQLEVQSRRWLDHYGQPEIRGHTRSDIVGVASRLSHAVRDSRLRA